MEVCRDSSIGDQLHAYELGILPDLDRDRFESHLMECDECFRQARAFERTSHLFREENDIKGLALKLSRNGSDELGMWRRLKEFIGRRVQLRPPLRLMIPALGLIILVYPVYRIWISQEIAPSAHQTLSLYPTRGVGDNVILLGGEAEVEINFVFEGAGPDDAYVLSITSWTGEGVYTDGEFSDFSERGLDTIAVSVDRFVKGNYTLSIIDPKGEEPFREQRYTITVE